MSPISAPPSSLHLVVPGDSAPLRGALVAASGQDLEVDCVAGKKLLHLLLSLLAVEISGTFAYPECFLIAFVEIFHEPCLTKMTLLQGIFLIFVKIVIHTIKMFASLGTENKHFCLHLKISFPVSLFHWVFHLVSMET
jgi:hypothetical protein